MAATGMERAAMAAYTTKKNNQRQQPVVLDLGFEGIQIRADAVPGEIVVPSQGEKPHDGEQQDPGQNPATPYASHSSFLNTQGGNGLWHQKRPAEKLKKFAARTGPPCGQGLGPGRGLFQGLKV